MDTDVMIVMVIVIGLFLYIVNDIDVLI